MMSHDRRIPRSPSPPQHYCPAHCRIYDLPDGARLRFGILKGNMMNVNPVAIQMAVSVMQAGCHEAAKHWWTDPKTGADTRDNPMCFSQKLMLIVSELAEAMEGDRKSLMDDKLPHRQMREVELADALIRICDTAGGYGMDLAGAVVEKLAYNAQRADHKIEHRMAEGGKTY